MKRALEGLPEVESADVRLAADQADVRLQAGAALDLEEVRKAIARVVVLPRLRRVLAKLKKAVG